MLPQFLDMITIQRDGDRAILILHALLEDDFMRWALIHRWNYIKFREAKLPDEYVAYELFSNKTCDELEQRAAGNPWFAFTDADKFHPKQ